ncbi:MAG: hypothetical protein KGO22_11070, partial [Gammaproteobacteria bacterium]|nr:hypothetical protein [Gammaproteobacteria bacterium]
MGSFRRLHRISVAGGLAAGLAALVAGCAAVTIGQPTAVPGRGPLGVPQPTATQIAVGANPAPSAPRMNQFVAQVRPPGTRPGTNPYAWLENVHSGRTRHWIARENEAAARALAAIPQRASIRSRLEQPQGAASDVVVERAFYVGADGTRLPMEIAHRRDLARDGNQPALLTVERAASKPPGPLLDPFVLEWVRMGGVYARAQVRGGLASTPGSGRSGAAALPDRPIALSDLFA